MDYSFIVGVSIQAKELVVGVIDYLRMYTWDKAVESVIKTTQSKLLTSDKAKPTVLNPNEYRKRFVESMKNYFILNPTKWVDFSDWSLYKRFLQQRLQRSDLQKTTSVIQQETLFKKL